MSLIRRMLATVLVLSTAQAALAVAAHPDAITLVQQACAATDEIPRDATCLRATVPEDYEAPRGRTIGLDIVILKAMRQASHGEPLFVLQGGPGDRTTLASSNRAVAWADFHRDHDLVFVDQRGNGQTPDLGCAPEMAAAPSQAIDLWPSAQIAACGRRLSAHAKLARYTSTDAARDIDNVCAALGYRQIDLVGYSYGSRLAQEVLRRDDGTVRAALLIGPEAPATAVPAGMARTAQDSLLAILGRCKADAACSAAWPDADGDLERLQRRLSQGPLLLHAKGGDPQSSIGPGVVATYLRSRLYSAKGAATLPRSINALSDANRDQVELAAIAAWRRDFDTWAPLGMYMAVTCAEDLPFVDVEAERRAAEGTFLGSYRIDQQSAACRAWPRAQPNVAVHKPVTSSVPTLLLVGEFDPATPSRFVASITASLSHGRAVVVPNRGHSMPEDWDACLGKVSTSFLEAADATHLDTACLARLRMPPFDTTPASAN